MRYRHAPDRSDADLDAALVSAPGRPTLPVRLTLELFGRAHAALGRRAVTVWDPCCGAGTTLAVLGLRRGEALTGLLGTDVDAEPLGLARRNMALLDTGGIAARAAELDALAARHGKPAYADAAAAVRGLDAGDGRAVPHELAVADATDADATGPLVRRLAPAIVIADLPHGVQTRWSGAASAAADVVAALAAVLPPDAVIAVAGRGRTLDLPAGTRAAERLRAGHRAAAIVRAGDVPPTA